MTGMYRLLVVDDEPIIIRGIRSLIHFEELGISEVYEATNGEEALSCFKEHLPDLVLADINMPKMNGLDFVIAAKEIKPDVKIAMITGYDHFDYALTALKAGVNDYVLKPVTRKEIQVTLQKLINLLKTTQQQQELTKVVEDMLSDVTVEDTGYKFKIQKEIEKNINNPSFSLRLLAKELALTPSYTSTVFKNNFGKTFQDYILTTRLERAKIYLLSTDMKIYEIAEAVGFEDANYFSASFKKKWAYSPNQYRERVKE